MRGDLYVISAPSGTGKTTLCRMLLKQMNDVSFSVSHTTRAPRPGEVDGIDYHFVSREAFNAMIEQGAFLEWAEVHGHFYGTSREGVFRQLEDGLDVLLDIDVQGARQVKKSFPEAVMIFILPPTFQELEQRLRSRGTEDEANLRTRIENAKKEVLAAPEYDYILINDILEEALDDFKSIIKANRHKSKRMVALPKVKNMLIEAEEAVSEG